MADRTEDGSAFVSRSEFHAALDKTERRLAEDIAAVGSRLDRMGATSRETGRSFLTAALVLLGMAAGLVGFAMRGSIEPLAVEQRAAEKAQTKFEAALIRTLEELDDKLQKEDARWYSDVTRRIEPLEDEQHFQREQLIRLRDDASRLKAIEECRRLPNGCR